MAFPLKQSTATTVRMGPFKDAADGVTDEGSLTIQKADVRLSKGRGDFAAASQDQGASNAGAAYDENGHYIIELDTTDTNTLGGLRIYIQESGALPVWDDFIVMSANAYDALVAATDNLNVEVATIAANAITATSIASDAITAEKLASDVTTELQSGLATAAALTTVDGIVDDILADTADMQPKIPPKYWVTGTIGVVTSTTVFRVVTALDTPANSQRFKECILFRSSGVIERQRVSSNTNVDATHIQVTLANAYSSVPVETTDTCLLM